MQVEIAGLVDSKFEPVRTVFEALWDDVEVGASLCVYIEGEKVVDLWGGWTDREMTLPWQQDTLVNVYSTTKGLASAAIAILADEGLLEFNEKVTHYWPEFGAEGKQDVTVAQLLSHQAGLCGVDSKLTVEDLYDWDKMVNLLAAQKPLWPIGEGGGYHAVTWGYLPGELVRRITGKTLGEYFAEKVATPLGADCHIGLPPQEHHRCATMIGPNHARRQPDQAAAQMPSDLYPTALLNPSISPFRDASSAIWRASEIAAANAQANARGIATIYAALANDGELNGTRIISQEGIAEATIEEIGDDQLDRVLARVMRRARGFMLNTENAYGPNPHAFGHAGAGGSTGFADTERRLGFGYAMNQMQNDITATPRSQRLLGAVLDCLN